MELADNQQDIIVTCIESFCEKVSKGSKVILNGPMLNTEESNNVCMTALQAIYPYIVAARFKVPPEKMGFSKGKFVVQCPDKDSPVTFTIDKLER